MSLPGCPDQLSGGWNYFQGIVKEGKGRREQGSNETMAALRSCTKAGDNYQSAASTMVLFLIRGVDSWSSKVIRHFSDKLGEDHQELWRNALLPKPLPHCLQSYTRPVQTALFPPPHRGSCHRNRGWSVDEAPSTAPSQHDMFKARFSNE